MTALDLGHTSPLRRANVGAAVLHAVQAVAVLALATDFALPVTASYLAGPPGTPPQDPVVLFDIPTGLAVAGFLALSALAHLLVCTAWWPRYVADLGRQRNPARWVEYSLSSSLMIVLIAQLVGISDVAALVALFGVNTAMILFGWLQERYERPGSGGWLPFGFGCVAGVVPWVAITIYLLSPGSTSSASPPGFVYGIFVSLFVFFNVFALNQWLQYRAKGRWQDYLFGEKVYIVLSLTAKSALAWQIFAGTLAAMTEQQSYDVLAAYPEFELRRYPEHLVAEIEVGGPFELAGNLAFPRLARYIGGHNQSSRKVAMTAPVVQQQAPDSRRYVVGFVMPADVSAEDLPDPTDSAVRTRQVPAETAAALRFSGLWSRGSYEKRTAQLLAALETAGLTVGGDPRYARFDPPWTPWFLRRNEVVVPVAA